ncbi:thiol:disulfide interchange protein DsbC [Formosimonas limnophila]|uniref:Thiol:disulfide interchange protein n=1 Tax=Formosimonas limnophila TaxID=1384487 RepID=A0A8J3FZ28_9BURK|nr:DsbC family protein [Formosimonas limnophila]GHA70551.1 thiol:disulfide interchange protein DsbC [Formosimonas limnophila]
MAKTTWFKSLTGAAIVALGLATGLSINAQAKSEVVSISAIQSPNTNGAEASIKKTFELKFEKSQVKQVTKMPFGDLYEIVLDTNEIVYTNAATEFIMIGQIIDSTDMRNLTSARADELATIDFKSLPLKQAFTLVKGSGSRHIAIFEDPNCGYCKVFRKTLENVDNITIHTFAIDILGSNSTEKARALLCTADPAHAWDEWMLHNKTPTPKAGCDSTERLEKNRALAMKLGISGTPTIFFQNGKRAPGALPANEFNALLQKNSQP